TWYEQQDHYMDTIVDEHYYRSNDYLLRNADRYNYYYRAVDANGQPDEVRTSKVFVGEYASNDKNTLAGAIAEAAVMTGFENNADVVRLAAYAPLFNKVLTDGTYRWTPDCIWFDDESIWFTPNYYVQQLFASYLGTQVLSSQYYTYRNGQSIQLAPQGGIQLSTVGATLLLKYITVICNESNQILFEQNFTQPLDDKWQWLSAHKQGQWLEGEGLLLKGSGNGRTGIFLDEPTWSNYRVEVIAEKVNGHDGIYVGVGLTTANTSTINVHEYVIGEHNRSTGLKVYKQGVEAYTLGDFSSSSMVGNMRAAYDEQMQEGHAYHISINYGGSNGKELSCTHAIVSKEWDQQWSLTQDDNNVVLLLEQAASSRINASPAIPTVRYKLEAYNDEIFYSITRDEKAIYIKLVNADATAKPLQIGFGEAALKGEYRCIQLTGDASLLHTPNVNKKAAELITPLEQILVMQDGQARLDLPAHSVQVLILELI
ncbi:MAG TPA: alpha-L-arabinofuranosidase, partial [Candidatus Paenibacillus intestinavium]|nr:alpha-L-arabinofuranosidase [Candidatus Paenibacillus intestinavium]